MKRSTVVGALLTGVLLLAPVPAGATDRQHPDCSIDNTNTGPHRERFTVKTTVLGDPASEAIIDADRSGADSLGDYAVGNGDLSQDGTKIGRLHFTQFATEVTNAIVTQTVLTEIFKFPCGQIVTEFAQDLGGDFDAVGNVQFIAVLGGTGIYRHVSGQVRDELLTAPETNNGTEVLEDRFFLRNIEDSTLDDDDD